MPYKIEKPDAEWKSLLQQKGAEPLAFDVTRHEATERAFTGKYADHKAAGTYTCICCGKALFSADTKFDSGTGWPSYFRPIAEDAVGTHDEWSGSASFGFTLAEKVGAYAEYFAFGERSGTWQRREYVNGGVTYLLSDALQLDARYGVRTDAPSRANFVGIGLSRRF